MVQVLTRPEVEEPIVIPTFKDQYEYWSWLSGQASEDQLNQVAEKGSCQAQTILKIAQLSAIMEMPVFQTF